MELHVVETDKIVVPEDRVRKEFDKGKLQKLADSFEKLGQLQPGVCIEGGDGSYQLVAGERRFRACKLAKLPFLFILREDADPLLLKEIELEENLNRVDLTWQEEVFGLDELHRLREEQKGKQRVKDTASELGRSVGQTHEDLEIAIWAREFKEVADAKSKGEAKKIIKRFKGELVRDRLLEQAVDRAGESKARTEEWKEEAGAEALPEGEEEDFVVVQGTRIAKSLILDYNHRVIFGDMESELAHFRDESVNLVLFDPPWGVNYDSVRKHEGGTDDFEDDEKMVWEKMPGWFKLLFQKMAPDSHLYLFFGIVHHSRVYDLLESVGFSTNRIPLIWYKQGAHRTRNPEIWPGRSYEPIAYARKGAKALLTQGAPDVVITSAPTPSMKQDHPSAKHPEVYKELLERSAYPGDTVLDPMCGSGMAGVACEMFRGSKKLDWWMIEQKESFRDLALANVIKGYTNIVSKQLEPVPGSQYTPKEPAADYHSLDPGSEDWMIFWKAHPELQDEMLEWRKEQEGR